MARTPTSQPHGPDYPTWSVGVLDGIQERKDLVSPGAGVEWKYTVPGGYWQRLLIGSLLFTTSAAAGNRVSTVAVGDGGVTLGYFPATSNVGPGVAARQTIVSAFALNSNQNPTAFFVLPIPYVWLPSGYTIGSSTQNFDVGDTYTQIHLWFESLDESEWRAHTERHRHVDALLATRQHPATAPHAQAQGGTH